MTKFFHHCHWEICKHTKRSEPNSAMEALEENFILQVLPYSNIWIETLCNVYSGSTVLISVGVMQHCKPSCTKILLCLEMTSSNLLSGMSGIALLWVQLMFQVKIIVCTEMWRRAEINRIPDSLCLWHIQKKNTKRKIVKTDKWCATCLQYSYIWLSNNPLSGMIAHSVTRVE